MKTILTIGLLFMAMTTYGQEQLVHSIKVIGEGVVKIIPDNALVTIGVENKGATAQQVKNENDKTVATVIAKCKAFGIKEKDLQTQYVNLNKNYDYNKKAYKYTANQTIGFKIRELANYDQIMSALLASGINRINGVQFVATEIESLKEQARKKAVTNAKKKALEYAGILGQEVGKAIQISELQDTAAPMPHSNTRMMSMSVPKDMGSNGPTIAFGELSVSSKIYIIFELK